MLKENNFIEYLNNKGYYYDTQTIENFLLSIKSNNLIIISGKSGTGKTTLINSYLDFISTNTTNKTIKSSFKLGKTITSKGFSFIRDDATPIYPKNQYEDECYLNVDGIKVKSRLNIVTRLFFKHDENKDFVKYLEDPNKNKDDKIEFELILNEKDSDFFNIIETGSYSKKDTTLNEYDRNILNELMHKANNNPYQSYFLIMNNMNESSLNILYNIEKNHETKKLDKYYDYKEIPQNLNIICEINNDNFSNIPLKLIDYVNIINLETISPMDYFNGRMNILDKNNSYLTNSDKVNVSTNFIKNKFLEMKIENDLSLWDVIYTQLEDFYNILEIVNLEFGFRTINNILKYMYIAWEYENKPETFFNWEHYFDCVILQILLPRLSGSNKKIEYVLNDLRKYCINNYEYIYSYNKIEKMILNLNNNNYCNYFV